MHLTVTEADVVMVDNFPQWLGVEVPVGAEAVIMPVACLPLAACFSIVASFCRFDFVTISKIRSRFVKLKNLWTHNEICYAFIQLCLSPKLFLCHITCQCHCYSSLLQRPSQLTSGEFSTVGIWLPWQLIDLTVSVSLRCLLGGDAFGF